MKSMKKRFIPLFFIAFFSIIPLANAQDPDIDIEGIPQAFADALGTSLFAGQLLASAIFVTFFLFPTMLLTHKKSDQTMPIIIVGILTMGVCVAFGWLPYWILLITSLIISLMFAGKMKDTITG